MVEIMQNTQEKADLQKTKVNAMKITEIRADGNKFILGKNGGHRPSSLGGRLIVVVSERVSELVRGNASSFQKF